MADPVCSRQKIDQKLSENGMKKNVFYAVDFLPIKI